MTNVETEMVIRSSDDTSSEGASGDENKERGNWSRKIDFILACVGYAVGLGNVWRFPYLCYRNGGGAFLIPYTIMLAIVGLPMFFMELALGQFASLGPITVWKVCPMFKGIGVGMVAVSTFVAIYYNIVISYAIFYLAASFAKEVPWKSCNNDWNTASCLEPGQSPTLGLGLNPRSPAEEYWDPIHPRTQCKNGRLVLQIFGRYVLDMTDSIDNPGKMRWQLALCLLLAWIVVCLCIIKGVKSSGKVVYFTALFPYVVLIILLVRGLTLEGSGEGIKYYMTPDWDRIKDPKVWGDAATQIFYSLGVSWGGLIMMSSYNKFHNNVYRDAIMVAVINCSTSVFAGFVIFSMIGFIAHEKGIAVSDAVASGPGLAFVAYPEGIAQMPVTPLWGILFFLMLWTLGLDSMFVLVEVITTSLADEFTRLRRNKMLLTVLVSAVLYLIGLSMCTQGGIYVMNLFDWYSASYGLLGVALLELLALMQAYEFRRFAADIQTMLGFRPNFYWKFCWTLLAPMAVMFILISLIVDFTPITLGDYEYPKWGDIVGMMFTVLTLIWVPIFMVVAVVKAFLQNRGVTFLQCLTIATSPTEDWGPALPEHRPDVHKSVQTVDSDWLESSVMNQNGSFEPGAINKAFESEKF